MISRADITRFALKYAGASALNDRVEEYLDLLSRGKETPQMREDMGRMSSCALFIRALWWFLGLDHPIYEMGYKNGQAPADVLKIAKSMGAVINGTKLSKSCYPRTGDAFYVATAEGKREHFGLIARELPCPQANVWKYETVEGGQGPGGRAIEKCFRTFIKNGMWGITGDRLLISWMDADSLKLPGLRQREPEEDEELEPTEVPVGFKEDPYVSPFDEQAVTNVEVPVPNKSNPPSKKKRRR